MLGRLGAVSPSVAQRGVGSPWDHIILSQAGSDLVLYALTKAIIARESEWNPNASNPSDPSYGLMQVMITTARGISASISLVELMDPATNIAIGMTYLRGRLQAYPILADAVSAYNAGRPISGNAGYVDDVLAYYAWYWSNDPVLMAASGISAGGTPVDQVYINTFTGQVVDPTNVATDPATGATTDSATGDPVALQDRAPSSDGSAVGIVLALAAVGALLLSRR